jgi:hypothetical protein
VQKFVDLSKKIGGDASTHGDLVLQAFKQQAAFIAMASASKKPAAVRIS